MSANRNAERGYQATIPKPVAELLELDGDKDRVEFYIVPKTKRVGIRRGEEKQ